MSENMVVVKKVIKASREEVFEAFTNPKIIVKWFYGEEGWTVDVSNTLEIGGKYTLTTHKTNGKDCVHVGEYRIIAPPEKLVFSWNTDSVQNTVVTIYFRQVEGGTEITLEHEFLLTHEAREDHRRGWMICLGNLERLYT